MGRDEQMFSISFLFFTFIYLSANTFGSLMFTVGVVDCVCECMRIAVLFAIYAAFIWPICIIYHYNICIMLNY